MDDRRAARRDAVGVSRTKAVAQPVTTAGELAFHVTARIERGRAARIDRGDGLATASSDVTSCSRVTRVSEIASRCEN